MKCKNKKCGNKNVATYYDNEGEVEYYECYECGKTFN